MHRSTSKDLHVCVRTAGAGAVRWDPGGGVAGGPRSTCAAAMTSLLPQLPCFECLSQARRLSASWFNCMYGLAEAAQL